MKKGILLLFLGLATVIANAQTLVKDNSIYTSSISGFVQLGNTIYFTATENIHGYELWKTDGTEAGTNMVIDLYPGAGDGCRALTVIGNYIYFAGNDSIHGLELWKTDGTALGTTLVRDINVGTGWGPAYRLSPIFKAGTELYFVADDSIHGQELWKSDGTTAGTMMVKDIFPGTGGGADYSFFADGNTVYFGGNDSIHGLELWKTDGTNNGTIMVKDINTNGTNSPSDPYVVAKLNNKIFFIADNGTIGYELWTTDGTDTGTHLVKDIFPGSSSSYGYYSNTFQPFVFNNALYFDATDGVHGYEIWKSDGTSNGTNMLKDIYPGANSNPKGITLFNNRFFFQAFDGVHGYEIWSSDGTEAGTNLFLDLDTTNTTNGGSCIVGMIAANGRLFFNGKDNNPYCRLWATDGTTNGTNLICGNECVAMPLNFFLSGNTLFFAGSNAGGYNNQLWKLDLTALEIQNISTPAFQFSISPNPASSTVTITIDETLLGSNLIVTDITGKRVAAVQPNTQYFQLNTANFTNGIYFVTIGNTTKKLIVNK